jgi:exonuclease III
MSNTNAKPSRETGLKILYFNARSIRNKLSDLHDAMYNQLFDIICISETWLNAVVMNGLIDPQSQFKIYRRDRQTINLGGGVCILVRNSLISSVVDIDYTVIEAEIVACTIVCGKQKLTFVCVYIAPNVNNEIFIEVIKCMEVVCLNSDKCIIVGDFNVPKIDWINLRIPSDVKCQTLFSFYADNGLYQLVNEPTRLSNTLDLLFTNDQLLVSDVSIEMPFSTSDHDSLRFYVYFEQSQSHTMNTIF